ncbi:hypothetical protein CF319_g8763 [Tilletia indica]|nr:hypothetical protein CF319_g8763 [Tilletia indica]
MAAFLQQLFMLAQPGMQTTSAQHTQRPTINPNHVFPQAQPGMQTTSAQHNQQPPINPNHVFPQAQPGMQTISAQYTQQTTISPNQVFPQLPTATTATSMSDISKVEHGAPRSAPYSGTPTPARSAGNSPVDFLLRTPSKFCRFWKSPSVLRETSQAF